MAALMAAHWRRINNSLHREAARESEVARAGNAAAVVFDKAASMDAALNRGDEVTAS